MRVLMYWLCCVLLQFSITCSGATLHTQNAGFREDYFYMSKTESFYKFHTELKSWIEAKQICESESATLFYPNNEAEANLLIEYWKRIHPSVEMTYIGISDRAAEGVFVTIDGLPISKVYNRWNVGEPNNRETVFGVSEDCAVLPQSGYLNDIHCKREQPFICKNKRNRHARSDYYYIFQTDDYYKFHTVRASWFEAKQSCALERATLFYPDNKAEADLVIKYWKRTHPSTDEIHIGVSDLVARGIFETVDGHPISEIYNEWDETEPYNAVEEEDCLSLKSSTGHIYDRPCSLKLRYICKIRKSTIKWNIPCNMPDDGYTINNQTGKCYKLHTSAMTWPQAHAACYAEQSYLAIINNEEEAKEMVKIAKTAPTRVSKIGGCFLNDTVLLGFHNRLNDGWTTVKGQRLGESNYSLWSPQQPDNDEEKQCDYSVWGPPQASNDEEKQCGGMHFNGLLNSVECNKKAFFICEHDVIELTKRNMF